MSDDRLRELERCFRKEGTVEAEAAWITARIQAGELPAERVRLAAFLGHEGARASSESPLQPPRELGEWSLALASFESEVLARACLAAAWAIVPFWKHHARGVELFDTAQALCELEQQLLGAALPSKQRVTAEDIRASAEAPHLSVPWGSYPKIVSFLKDASPFASPETLGECLRLGVPQIEELLSAEEEAAELSPASLGWLAERGIETLGELAAVTCAELDQDARLTETAQGELRTLLGTWGYAPGSSVDEEDLEVSLVPQPNPFFRAGGVRAAIGEELIPWALGYSDPVRIRVAMRGEVESAREDPPGC